MSPVTMIDRIAKFMGYTHKHGHCLGEHKFVVPDGCSCRIPGLERPHWVYKRCSECREILSILTDAEVSSCL